MINFGLLSFDQANTHCIENALMFDVWEIMAPKVERDLTNIDNDESMVNEADVTLIEDYGISKTERNYRKELRNMQVSLQDLKVMLMMISRLNDGKTFIESEQAPLPQSEGEIGFRDSKTGDLNFRIDELPRLHKHFDALYIN